MTGELHCLTEAVARHAATAPDRPALTGPDGTLTHREVYEHSLAVAAGLRACLLTCGNSACEGDCQW